MPMIAIIFGKLNRYKQKSITSGHSHTLGAEKGIYIMNKKTYKVAVALNNGIEGIKFIKVEAYDKTHLIHILRTRNLEFRFIDSVITKRKYCVKTYRFERGIRLQDTHEFYEEYKDAKLFFNKYALENKYVMLWLCENDGSDICEIESHKPTLKTKEEILAFMKESWGEEAVTEYISNDGKQCYRVLGNTIHFQDLCVANTINFQDLCERAHIKWKWVDGFRQVAKGSDFELEYCKYDIILAFEK